MRILFLTQVLPYPPELGASVKTWNVLRYLSFHGYDVTLASFVRPDEVEHVSHLELVCSEVYTVPLKRSFIHDASAWLRSQLTGRPFLVERDDLPRMRLLVQRLLEENRYDLIHTDQLTMAQYALPSPVSTFRSSKSQIGNQHWNPKYIHPNSTPRLVYDAHNAIWIIVERLRNKLPRFLHPIIKMEARRIKAYEGMLLTEFDHALAPTEFDREALYQAWETARPTRNNKRRFTFYQSVIGPTPITVVPVAVDAGPVTQIVRRPGSRNILGLGGLENSSDADGLRWFLKEVFPHVVSKAVDVHLTLVGKNPSADLCRYAAAYPGRVTFMGCQSDPQPFSGDCALVVAPVRLGTGMRGYILEAMARGMPVITTTTGLEGIDAIPGEEVLVADTPKKFVTVVLDLLADERLQAKLSEGGRKYAQDRHDWMTALKSLDNVYKKNGLRVPA